MKCKSKKTMANAQPHIVTNKKGRTTNAIKKENVLTMRGIIKFLPKFSAAS